MRAVIYTRISSDPTGTKAGVARQEKECRALADARGWEVVDVYTDNDRSAYSGKPRPDYGRLLTDIEAGQVDALIAWHPDRLHRSPLELNEFIRLVDSRGVAIATVQGGLLDLTTPSGRVTARIVGDIAAYESEHKSARQKSKALELAREGKVSGGGDRPFGYEADRVTIRESEAVWIREAADRLLSGATLRSVTMWLNSNNVATTRGAAWSLTTFKRMITSARIAGLRSHLGEVVGPAVWPAIITPDQHRAIDAIMARNRSIVKRSPRKYLATGGLAVCGLCDAHLVARPREDGRRCYICARGPGFNGCGKIRVLAEPFEDWLRDSVLEAIAGPGLAAAIEDVDAHPAPIGELEALEGQLTQLAVDHYSDNLIGRAEYLAARESIDAKIDALTATVTSKARSRFAGDLTTATDLAEVWESKPLEWRRQLVDLVVEKVTTNPAVKGRNFFDPARFTISWRA